MRIALLHHIHVIIDASGKFEFVVGINRHLADPLTALQYPASVVLLITNMPVIVSSGRGS